MKKIDIFKKIFVVLLTIGIIIAFGFLDPSVKNIDDVIKNVNPAWITAALFSALAYFIFDTLAYMRICSLLNVKQKFSEALPTTMIGFFYSALTPFQSGGQPMQIIQMKTRGIHVGTSTSILVIKFLAWQTAVTLFGTVSTFFMRNMIAEYSTVQKIMFLIGYIVNAACIVIACMSFFKTDFVYRLGNGFLKFLNKIKFLKGEKLEKSLASWKNTLDDYALAMNYIIKNKFRVFLIFLISLAEFMIFMSITYFIYRAFGLDEKSLLYIILLQALLNISVSFIPLPGASIASEGGFYVVFGRLFPPEAIFPSMLMWRVFTYYLNILLGLVFVLIDGFKKVKVRNQN